MSIVLLYLLCACSCLLDESFSQQYGHHNMPGAGAGPRPRLPTQPPAAQPDAVPGLPSLPTRPLDKPTPTTRLPTSEKQTTKLLYMPQTSQQISTDPVPVPSIPSTDKPRTVSNTPSYPRSCTPQLCKNKGRCVYNQFNQPQCKCRYFYFGSFCEVIVSPPKNISMTQLSPEEVQISWEMPSKVKEMEGFIVQYNEFGDNDVTFSQMIHPSVTQFTLRNLKPGRQYTICISIVFHNVSLNKEAVLRDQCREIQTKQLSLGEKGISVPVMAAIIACVILFLFIIMTVALFVQRKCLKQKVIPLRGLRHCSTTRGSVNWERGMQPSSNTESTPTCSDEYDTAKVRLPLTHGIEGFRPIKPNTNPFLSPPSMHSCADINEPYYGNLFHGNNSQVIMLTQQTCVSHGSSAPPDVTDTNPSCSSSHLAQCTPSRRLQRIGSVPPANIRALPVTISNHVMRSANVRDMDASGEFDLHRTYFFPKF
ncbi:uncharacterized protein LOC119722026 [Patiria miniata]|uniref:Fibronectin type-III domain-containing protein n=1 Tax=Patiria miniata TaxID=46514 RepID=A0A913ZAA3_PATMI|nr:uncharacterized protein LOC119722026 [Patiria miniata]